MSTQKRQALLAVSVLGLAGLVAGLMLMPAKPPAPRHPALAAAPAPPALAAPAAVEVAKGRRIYPFSVVPGGVASREELARVVNRDPVVAEHYAGFNVDIARVVTLAKPRAVYVSYRKGDKIFWTAKKIMLPTGETLLTDGVNEVRTRCGNRVSDQPQMPVSADEPSLEVLDSSALSEGGLQLTGAPELDPGEGDFAGPSHQLQTFGQADQALGAAGAGAPPAFGTPGVGGQGLGLGPAYLVTAPRNATMAPALIGSSGDTPGAAGGASIGSDASGSIGGSGGAGASNTGDGAGNNTAGGSLVDDVTGPQQGAEGAPGFVGMEETVNLTGPGQIKPAQSDIEAPDSGPRGPLAEPAVLASAGEVPEPATLLLMLVALAGLALLRRRRVRKA